MASEVAFVEKFVGVSFSSFMAFEKTLNEYLKDNFVIFERSSSNRSTNIILRYEWVYYKCSRRPPRKTESHEQLVFFHLWFVSLPAAQLNRGEPNTVYVDLAGQRGQFFSICGLCHCQLHNSTEVSPTPSTSIDLAGQHSSEGSAVVMMGIWFPLVPAKWSIFAR
ncbi:hypothetical protein T265_06899 [Opisthorchis viverrini]|uniref:Uncharacterized protein n=1 Tax=Opisthorchis viverrini TaxID=6198 RepID=A0A075ACZ2_OPIVI|nr:hypothetical protein T265_06899 [Opisthorchis viverrini]KER25729.1 hypothetical protein T265_06899 [Opisthorchis viverrini]